MASYLLSPGAWLSGSSTPGSALHPEPRGGVPNSASLMPEPGSGVPLFAGWMPEPGSGVPLFAGWMPEPRRRLQLSAGWMPEPQTGSQPAGPKQAIDAARVDGAGEQALLAQALAKVRTRIVRPEDPRRAPAGKTLRAADDREPLWRWQPQFRVKAAETELLGRLVVHGLQLWWVPPPPAVRAAAGSPQPLFTLTPPPLGFDYSLQIDKVLRAATERDDRMPEILTQANDIGVFFDSVTGIDRGNAPRLAELLELLWSVTTAVVMALKNRVAEFRPVQRSAQVQPLITTPGHGSLPSGHATMATVTAAVLSTLLYGADAERRMQLELLARRIAFNRVVAGVHFPMDSEAGHVLGTQLAAAFVAAAGGGAMPGEVPCTITPGSELKETPTPTEMTAVRSAPSFARPGAAARDASAAPAPLLALMFDAAAREVALLRV